MTLTLHILKQSSKNSGILNLSDRGILDTDIPDIVNFLSEKKNIEELNLYRNNISDEGIISLIENLNKDERYLKKLGLGYNNITDKTLSELTKYEKFLKSLEELDIRESNSITLEGFSYISTLKKINSTLNIILPQHLQPKKQIESKEKNINTNMLEKEESFENSLKGHKTQSIFKNVDNLRKQENLSEEKIINTNMLEEESFKNSLKGQKTHGIFNDVNLPEIKDNNDDKIIIDFTKELKAVADKYANHLENIKHKEKLQAIDIGCGTFHFSNVKFSMKNEGTIHKSE